MLGGGSLTALLQERATRQPDATAYTFIGYELDPNRLSPSLTWAQLHRRAQGSGKVRRSASTKQLPAERSRACGRADVSATSPGDAALRESGEQTLTKQRVVDHIVEHLAATGVDYIFGVDGANIEDLYDHVRYPRAAVQRRPVQLQPVRRVGSGPVSRRCSQGYRPSTSPMPTHLARRCVRRSMSMARQSSASNAQPTKFRSSRRLSGR
jgi:hypothetical protein